MCERWISTNLWYTMNHKLIQLYGPNVMIIEMVRCWLRQFKEGTMEVLDHDWVSGPSETIMDNLVTAIHVIIEEDRHITFPTILCDIWGNHFIKISQDTLHTIIHKHLNLSTFFTFWVPNDSTEEHCTKQIGTALHLFLLYHEFAFCRKFNSKQLLFEAYRGGCVHNQLTGHSAYWRQFSGCV